MNLPEAGTGSAAGAVPPRSPVPLAVRGVVLGFLAIVPFRIVAQGYRPGDDALRHVAKALSGRDWSEVLVLRPDVVMDSHPGWHALLGLVHGATGADAHALLVFSIIVGYLAFILPAVFLIRRPEAWALSLFAFGALEGSIPTRFASGRPFLLSMGALVVLCLLAARPGSDHPGWRGLGVVGAILGLAIWTHPSWYLFLLPVLVCLLARRWRLAATLLAGLLLGLVVAGLLYGHPVTFVSQSVLHALLAFGSPAPPGTLVREFLPGDGSAPVVLAVLLLLLWRKVRGDARPDAASRAVFLLAGVGWMLGWLVVRFWSDWGVPALLVWVALELQLVLEAQTSPDSWRRLVVSFVGGIGALLVLSANTHGQRFLAAERPYLSLSSEGVEHALPDPGGILYTDDMRLFYELFYSRPRAPWRYIVGYEPALMPPEDLATFRRLLAVRTPASFEPWVRKMRPQDRLIIQSTQGEPRIEGLVWTQVSATVWSGRVPGSPRDPRR